jgi:hypothetical protein
MGGESEGGVRDWERELKEKGGGMWGGGWGVGGGVKWKAWGGETATSPSSWPLPVGILLLSRARHACEHARGMKFRERFRERV